jgi:CO/xanthine dehydrogenase Mo-binding subunit
MSEHIVLHVNGTPRAIDIDDAEMPLLYALREELGLNNPHFGCGLAQCGACTVHVNGVATRSCVTPVSTVVDAEITTLAGLGTPEHPAYIDEQVPQCGYCINGWIMTAAVVAEVEVERRTGKVRPRRFIVAHDCGLVVNPDGLRYCIEGNIAQGTSRSLWEEVMFDRAGVTSVDWASYPILDIAEAPKAIDIVLINRTELPPYGAGEAAIRPVAAAIANAIFDATGVRLRRAPFTPDRVKASLA